MITRSVSRVHSLVVPLCLLACCGLATAGCGSVRTNESHHRVPETFIVSVAGNSFLADGAYQIGPYVVRGRFRASNLSLAGAERAFGTEDRCRMSVGGVSVSWPLLGVRGLFTTLGGFVRKTGKPDFHGNGCEYRSQVQPDSLTVFASRWKTARGLRIGDPVSTLYRLYPNATFHSAVVGDPSGWWLQSGSIVPGTPSVQGELVAHVVRQHIASLRIDIDGEGE
jgi:hypothetical protein